MNEKIKIDTIILVGGLSSRMGKPKAYLPFNGKTFFELITEKLSKFGDVYVSIDKKENMKIRTNYKIIEDEYDKKGPLAAIYTTLKNIKNEFAFIIACDMPFVSEDYISFMIENISKDKEGVFAIDESGRVETMAAIYSKKMLTKLKSSIEADEWKILNGINLDNCVLISREHIDEKFPNVYKNINTEEEYMAIRKDI